MCDMFTKVHIVFENEHLMKRDNADFESYWILLGYDESQIEYHIGCDFVPLTTELLIIDEADAIIFANPVKFKDFVQ